MKEMKYMNYQRLTEYLNESILEMGHYDDVSIAVEQSIIIGENPTKLGYPIDSETEIICVIDEVQTNKYGGSYMVEDGYLVLLHVAN